MKWLLVVLLALGCAGGDEGYEELGKLEQAYTVYPGGGAAFPDTFGITAPQTGIGACSDFGGNNPDGEGCKCYDPNNNLCVYPAYKQLHIRIGTPSSYYPHSTWAGYVEDGVDYAIGVMNAKGWLLTRYSGTVAQMNTCPQWYGDYCEHQLLIKYDGWAPVNRYSGAIRYTAEWDPNKSYDNVIMDVSFGDGFNGPDPYSGFWPSVVSGAGHRYWTYARASVYDENAWQDSSLSAATRGVQISRAAAHAVFAACGLGEDGSSGTLRMQDWHGNASSINGDAPMGSIPNVLSLSSSFASVVTLRDW